MRLLLHAAAVLIGAAIAVAAVVVHRSVVLGIPYGVLLALATTLATMWALRDLLPGLAASCSAGWLMVFGFALFGKPEGDYVVATDLRGYAMIVGALVVVAVGVSSLARRRAPSAAGAT